MSIDHTWPWRYCQRQLSIFCFLVFDKTMTKMLHLQNRGDVIGVSSHKNSMAQGTRRDASAVTSLCWHCSRVTMIKCFVGVFVAVHQSKRLICVKQNNQSLCKPKWSHELYRFRSRPLCVCDVVKYALDTQTCSGCSECLPASTILIFTKKTNENTLCSSAIFRKQFCNSCSNETFRDSFDVFD